MKVLICDLDKTLLPYGGTSLDEVVLNKMLKLQEKGMRIVLASARLAGGVYPIAQQLQLDKYHGFVIANNGSFTYDMQKRTVWNSYAIPYEVCENILEFAKRYGLHVAIEQETYTVTNDYDEGIAQDRINCAIDVIIAQDAKKHIQHPIYKCSISGSADIINQRIGELKVLLSENFDVFRSTGTFIDVITKGCSKEKAVKDLLAQLNIPISESVAIGDGDSDAYMIQQAGLGVTLENGSALCKKYADMIVPSCFDMGCITLLDYLLDKLS